MVLHGSGLEYRVHLTEICMQTVQRHRKKDSRPGLDLLAGGDRVLFRGLFTAALCTERKCRPTMQLVCLSTVNALATRRHVLPASCRRRPGTSFLTALVNGLHEFSYALRN